MKMLKTGNKDKTVNTSTAALTAQHETQDTQLFLISSQYTEVPNKGEQNAKRKLVLYSVPVWMNSRVQKLQTALRLEMMKQKSEEAKSTVNISTAKLTAEHATQYTNVANKSDHSGKRKLVLYSVPVWMKSRVQKLQAAVLLEIKKQKSEKAKHSANKVEP